MIDDDLLKRRLKNENVTIEFNFNIVLIKIFSKSCQMYAGKILKKCAL